MLNTDKNQHLPVYELFFAPLVAFNPTDYERVQFAYFASKFGHDKQIVREDGSRYFDHPKSAAWIYIHELNGRDPRVIIDLLLHDISEDTYLLSPYRICLNFGEEVALDVRAVTKLPNGKETIEDYLLRVIAQGPWAIITKLCDRLHNLRTLAACSIEKQNKQITETERYHLPMLIPALSKFGGEWAIYAAMLKEKIEYELAISKQRLS